mmetsp:Transcript_19538/g.32134  ORF Transcript_19538/g.32134 Transcript_19538/m.32134 type:complete len:825 (-) Transcript_19538:38-2512(-)
MGFSAFTIGVICVLVVLIAVPLIFFIISGHQLCCGETLAQEFEKQQRSAEEAGEEPFQIQKPPRVFCSFKSVRYTVPIGNNEDKEILKGVSAYFKPGTLSAIMGPSGCGKSTLLDILADQKEFGTISGDIRINGEPRTSLFRRASAYVMQFDVLYAQLTPRETLYFVVELRMKESVSREEKRNRVIQTLKELDLTAVADTRMGDGDGGGGLSGGQKRRVTVAIELVTSPGLILLDEPTSGLDAFGSLKLVQVLRNLADDGRTIACTIHQPRADIFNLFDNLLLIKLGVTMYFGPINGIFPYFESLGVPVDYNVNPADFIVDLTQDKSEEETLEENRMLERMQQKIDAIDENSVASGSRRDISASVTAPVVHVDLDSLCDSYAKSNVRKKHDMVLLQVKNKTLEEMPPGLEEIYQNEADANDDKYATSFFNQVFTLSKRAIINDMRNSAYVIGNWVIGPIMMLFYGLLYSNISSPENIATPTLNNNLAVLQAVNLANTTLAGYNNPFFNTDGMATCGANLNSDQQLNFVRSSLIYQLMAAAYFSESPYVSQVFLDKQMFFREHASRSYSSGAYHFAWYIRLFFVALLKGALFPPIGYFLAQLTTAAEPYFLFCIFFGAMSAAGSAMALLCSCIFPSLETATAVAVLVNVLAQNLSGYWIVQAYIPPWFIWLYYLNFFRYAFEGAVLGQQLVDTPSYRQDAWLYAMIVLIFAVAFQLIAFVATWLSHRTRTTDSGAMSLGLDYEEVEEATPLDDGSQREAGEDIGDLPEPSADRAPENGSKRQLRGISRRNVFDRYREAQFASSRNVNRGAGVNKNLANNGGMVYY